MQTTKHPQLKVQTGHRPQVTPCAPQALRPMRAAFIPKGPTPAPSDTTTCSVWCENNHQFSAARLRAGGVLAPLSGLPWPPPPRVNSPPVCVEISHLMSENSVEVRVSCPLSPSPLHQRTWSIVSRVCSWSQGVRLSVCLGPQVGKPLPLLAAERVPFRPQVMGSWAFGLPSEQPQPARPPTALRYFGQIRSFWAASCPRAWAPDSCHA